MKEFILKALSIAILNSLEPKEVIYAEVTLPGGMGNSGGIIIYILDKDTDQPICYETNIHNDEEVYRLAQDFLFKNLDRNITSIEKEELYFDYYHGGMGNSVLINKTAKLDIKENYFLYKTEQFNYKVLASCPGVFQNVVGQMKSEGQ